MIDMIESDADKLVEAPVVKRAETMAAARTKARVEGMFTQVDCLGKQARLHVAAGGSKLLLLVSDASSWPCAVQPEYRGTGLWAGAVQAGCS